jgi:hypothetical protein
MNVNSNNNECGTYLFRYNHNGGSWSFEIKADSPDDALQRVGRLAFATYEGEVVARVPASLGVPARFLVFARNLAQRFWRA